MDAYLDLLKSADIPYTQFLSLAPRTTFRIGGAARAFVCPRSLEELVQAIRFSKECEIRFRMLGRGSNLLVDDRGVDCAVISTEYLQRLSFCRGSVTAETGVPLSRLIAEGIVACFGGMENLFGIPGSIGGAVRMNAGAFDTEIADVLSSAMILDTDTMEQVELNREQMHFSYRRSLLDDRRYVLLLARFALKETDPLYARGLIDQIAQARKCRQPLDLPSAGSVFKRPREGFAAKLIDQAGLKGYRVGDAAVSHKHAGFIVNLGHATYDDVNGLIHIIRRKVQEMFGVCLQTEIELWTGG